MTNTYVLGSVCGLHNMLLYIVLDISVDVKN
jgi:hypothetical protein